MALLSPADQQKLREVLEQMTRPVRLLFFSQAIGCETCPETRQILDELGRLSEKISIEEVNLVLEGDKATQFGVDRAPAIAIVYRSGGSGGSGRSSGSEESGASPGSDGKGASNDEQPSNGMMDSRIRFLGAPSGYEFVSLIQAVLLAGGRESALSEASRDRLRAVDRPIAMQVFTTPT